MAYCFSRVFFGASTWRRLTGTVLAAVCMVAASGCMMDDEEDERGSCSEAGGAGGEGPAAASLAGVVTRSAALDPEQDGKGTLYVAALDKCDFRGGGRLLGAAAVPDADLSVDGAIVTFQVADLPCGTVHLAAFLDENGDADPRAARPAKGDLVYTLDPGDGIVNCVEAEACSGDARPVRVDLNFVEAD